MLGVSEVGGEWGWVDSVGRDTSQMRKKTQFTLLYILIFSDPFTSSIFLVIFTSSIFFVIFTSS